MIINHNLNAMNAHRNMTFNTSQTGKSMEKLSSGLRINRAGDDAAGLAISEKMRGQIRGLDQAARNSQDAISMIQTGEGALNETHSILQRMRELAVQAGNGTNTTSDRGEIQKEINQLTSEINRIGNTTEFNNQKLLNGNSLDITTTTAGREAKTETLGKSEITGTLAIGNVVVDGKTLAITGGDQDALYADLRTQILADVDLAAKYDISTYGAGDNKLTLTQKTGKGSETGVTATGSGATATEITKGEATVTVQAGKYDVGGKLSSGSIEVDGVKLSISGDDQDALYKDLKSKIEANADLASKYTIDTYTNGDNKLTLTQKAGEESSKPVEVKSEKSFSMQVGANENQTMVIDFADMRAAALKITGTGAGFTATNGVTNGTNNVNVENGLDVSTSENAGNAITKIQAAIDSVSGERSKLGAFQNRLEHTINNLGTSSENLQAAESRIRDVDMAKEMMTFSKNNILNQAAQAMLAQANQQPQSVLQLLR